MLPLAYFITFRCYGTWLHGDERGSVDRHQETAWGTSALPPNALRERFEESRMKAPPATLNDDRRAVVEATIRQTCTARGWHLIALNVRTNHVHVVLGAESPPEPVLTSLKAWSTRSLREAGLATPTERLWSRHGSTRYLWTASDVEVACEYVINGQGADLE